MNRSVDRSVSIRRFPRYPRFPRLPDPIRDFFDIPLTSDLAHQSVSWLVDQLIPERQLVLITGQPSSFKSFLVQHLAAAVSQGREFLGRSTKRTKVLMLDRENPPEIIAERRDILDMKEGNHLRIWGNWSSERPPDIDDSRLLEFAKKYCLVIIFDSLVRFHEADENSAKEMAGVMANLR
jgi:RecA-family ATPase